MASIQVLLWSVQAEAWLSGHTNLPRKCRRILDLATEAILTVGSVYQEYLAKSLTDKYGNLNVQMDKIINDANTELDSLNQKLAGKSGFELGMIPRG